MQTDRLYEFSPFRMNTAERVLLYQGEIVPLRPKCFDILLALIENSGHVVSKDQLMQMVWPDTFVEEGNLTFNISLLRKVLRENSDREYIETIPRRGYRFVADVRAEEITTAQTTAEGQANDSGSVAEAAPGGQEENDGIVRSAPITMAFPYPRRWPARRAALVAGALGVVLAVTLLYIGLTRRHTNDSTVYQLYVQGRAEWNKRTREGAEKAVDHFMQALARDPNYAPAYAGLADCYITLGSAIYPAPGSPRGIMPKARYNAEQALAIDPTLAEAHTSLAFVLLWYEWDFVGAKREFERAIELEPNYATAHQWYAQYLTAIGHHEEAIREARLACELDPTSANRRSILGFLLYLARQYNQALEEAERARQLNGRLRPMYCAGAYVEMGRYDEAVEYDLQANALAGEKSAKLDELRRAYQTEGIRGFWKKRIEQFGQQARPDGETARYYSIVYALLGEKDKAFAYLEKMIEERNGFLIYLKVDPAYDSLRSDPRFAELTRRIGLES